MQARQALRQQQQQVVAAFQKNLRLVLNPKFIVPIAPKVEPAPVIPEPPPLPPTPPPVPVIEIPSPLPIIENLPPPPMIQPPQSIQSLPSLQSIQSVQSPPQHHHHQPSPEPPVKSQIVDDVLEILIKNGELPASAANDEIQPMQIETNTLSPELTEQMNLELSEAMKNQHELHLKSNQFPNDLKDLALELETLDNDFGLEEMEIQESNGNVEEKGSHEMDMDEDEPDWLDSLMSSHCNSNNSNHHSNHEFIEEDDEYCNSVNSYDPLLVNNYHDPFELFGLEEFRSNGSVNNSVGVMNDLNSSAIVPTTITWDKLDFAA